MAWFLFFELSALPEWGAEQSISKEVDMEIRVLFLVSRENACGILSCLAAEDLVIMEDDKVKVITKARKRQHDR